MKKVRIAIKDGVLVMAGDPDSLETDSEYMAIIRDRGIVAVIPYEDYLKLPIYQPVPKEIILKLLA